MVQECRAYYKNKKVIKEISDTKIESDRLLYTESDLFKTITGPLGTTQDGVKKAITDL